MTSSSVYKVWKRELKVMFSRPIYLFSTIFVMGFSYLFFLTIMREGLPQRLPVAIVDNDNSSLSRRLCREINATQATEVFAKCSNYPEARELMQKGDIYGYVLIPQNFYNDLLSGKRPEISFYVNNSYMVAGTLSYRNLMTMATMASAAYQREILMKKGISNENQIMGRIQPVIIDSHLIGNPWSNYGVYLINLLLPGILQLMILLLTVFSIGSELKNRTSRDWLAAGNGSIILALTGKLLPYTILFSILGIAGNVLLYKFVGYPMNGSFMLFSMATVLFVIAHQAIGIFMIGLFPILRDALSFGALYGILSFSFAGFTFPIDAMPSYVQGLSILFPIRHYFQIYTNEVLNGSPFTYSIIYYAALISFFILPFIVIRRLKSALINQNYPLN
jgi:ABC-2 type transport system permease protein